jgi:hypothetical protein
VSLNDELSWLTGNADQLLPYVCTNEPEASTVVEIHNHFLRVSSLLGDATKDPTYLDAASLSFEFLSTHLYNHTTNEAMGEVDAATCKLTNSEGLIDNALFLEGTAILGETTGNETTKAL